MQGDPTRLLEITRRLTGGIVGGHRAHQDSFANKFNQRALLADQEGWRRQRLSPDAIILPLLPPEAHEAARARLQHIERLAALASPVIQIEAGTRSPPPLASTTPILHLPVSEGGRLMYFLILLVISTLLILITFSYCVY